MTVGSDFLSALATDLSMSDVAITRNETSITGYSGQIRLSGRPDSGVGMVIDLEQNFLTYQEEQSCLFCRPGNTSGFQAGLCTAAGIPMFQSGHYDHLLKLLRSKCERQGIRWTDRRWRSIGSVSTHAMPTFAASSMYRHPSGPGTGVPALLDLYAPL